jgi:beta-glucosidase
MAEPNRSDRVESLLARMTLREKIGQMTQHAWRRKSDAERSEEVEAAVRGGEIGSLLNATPLELRNRLQRIAVEESRLGVPLVFGRDVIHGYKTVFPIPLGLAASFDPGLVERTARAAAVEAVEDGIDWTFAPMVDVARDPRWGRVAEGSGEDPFLASAMGSAAVRGYQGEDPASPDAVAACVKHFAGYGAAEGGRDYNTTSIDDWTLRDVYLEPFRACVEAGVLTLMTAFNDLNGVPCSANRLIMRRFLRDTWGFDGMVVSDWAAVQELCEHGLCEDERDAAFEACSAGVDMEMATRAYANHVEELVETGRLPLDLVDAAVRRVLSLKHRLGLFERPFVSAPKRSAWLASDHVDIARRAVVESAVLLKNDAVLPLTLPAAVAVVGPLADDRHNQIGCWAFDGDREASITPLAALRDRLGAERVRYAPGMPDCRSVSREGFAAAKEAAAHSDVVLLFLGEDAILSGEGHSRAFLDLPGVQEELAHALAGCGKPLVVVVMAGRPLVLGALVSRAAAVLYAWHPGTMTGPGLTELLLGETSPSGKLPISFPRAVGQLPIYYNHKNTGRPPAPGAKGIPLGTPLDPTGMAASWLDVEVTPEFPFGFGLSYTEFEYSELEVSPPVQTLGAPVRVSFTLTNAGSRPGVEVTQLYVRDRVGSVTRPVRELKGFERVQLSPGESRRVTFSLTGEALAFHGRDLVRRVEPGKFMVWVGGSSEATLGGEFELVTP